MTSAPEPKRRPGRPRVRPPRLELTTDDLIAHPTVIQHLSEHWRRVLGPEFDPEPVVSKADEPPNISFGERLANTSIRKANRERERERVLLRKEVRRLGRELFDRGLLFNPGDEPLNAPASLPPTPVPTRDPITIADHNTRLRLRAMVDAFNDVTRNKERMQRVLDHATRRRVRNEARRA